MSAEDKLVWRILCTASPTPVIFENEEDQQDALDYISVFEFTSNYKRYANSFRRFKVTAEEFLSVLYEANSKVE